MSDNVTPLRPDAPPTEIRSHLVNGLADCIQKFEADGHTPSAGVWIVMDENGCYRLGWDTRNSVLPPSVSLSVALKALIRE